MALTMHHFLLLFIGFIGPVFLFAQEEPAKQDLHPCGAPPGIDPWLLEYSEQPDVYAGRGDDTLWVGVQIHLLASGSGSGRFSNERLLNAFCRLQRDFGPSRIQFFFRNPWNVINNTEWHHHDDIPTGIAMMLSSRVDSALNTYFVQDPAGNCGYNLPYAGVAVSHSCAGENDHTWAHEVGHALSLPHPFIGWEGKTYQFNTPTPLQLTYDYTYFHDTLDTTVPAPLDTAWVEFLGGSNCMVAADRFCDTPPDYLSYRWSCDGQGNSLTLQKDPDGNTFFSDGSLFMSYAADACQQRFSPFQVEAMRANLLDEKSAWLSPDAPLADVATPAVPLSPADGSLISGVQTLLQWQAAPHATHYHVLGSRISSFALREIDVITTDTALLTPALLPNKKYFWKVRPFNAFSTCAPYTAVQTFTTGSLSAIRDAGAPPISVFPNPARVGSLMVMEGELEGETEVVLYSLTGNLLGRTVVTYSGGRGWWHLPAGVRGPVCLVLPQYGLRVILLVGA
jgi:hypothetical protein